MGRGKMLACVLLASLVGLVLSLLFATATFLFASTPIKCTFGVFFCFGAATFVANMLLGDDHHMTTRFPFMLHPNRLSITYSTLLMLFFLRTMGCLIWPGKDVAHMPIELMAWNFEFDHIFTGQFNFTIRDPNLDYKFCRGDCCKKMDEYLAEMPPLRPGQLEAGLFDYFFLGGLFLICVQVGLLTAFLCTLQKQGEALWHHDDVHVGMWSDGPEATRPYTAYTQLFGEYAEIMWAAKIGAEQKSVGGRAEAAEGRVEVGQQQEGWYRNGAEEPLRTLEHPD